MNTKRPMQLLSVLPMTMGCLTLEAAPPVAPPAPFPEAELFVELNNTDGDLGIHGSIDGGPYSELEIDDPKDRTILRVTGRGRLARQGLTQLFFESAEPNFEELTPEQYFQRFPEGAYEIEAEKLDGGHLASTVTLSHVLAAAVSNILVSGVPAAESCDAPYLPLVSNPVIIDWDPVTTSHPTIGNFGDVEIAKYQFFVEREGVKIAVDLPPTVTRFRVPAQIIALGDEFKFEIIARTTTGNNTAIESCFLVQ